MLSINNHDDDWQRIQRKPMTSTHNHHREQGIAADRGFTGIQDGKTRPKRQMKVGFFCSGFFIFNKKFMYHNHHDGNGMATKRCTVDYEYLTMGLDRR